MRILHLGGFSFLLEAEAMAEQSAGHTTHIVPAFESQSILVEQPWETIIERSRGFQADVCVWHLSGREVPPTQAVESYRSATKQCFVVTSERLGTLNFIKHNDKLFVAAGSVMDSQPDSHNRAYYIPNLNISSVPRPEPYQPKWGELKLLYIPYGDSDSDVRFVLDTVESIQAQGARLLFAMIRPQDVTSEEFLRQRLSECDIFLESVSRAFPGPLAYLAMIYGKTVFSGVSERTKLSFEKLAKAPVVHVDRECFAARLSSVAKELKSLRDLGKRSRLFVESHCDINHAPCLKVE